MFNIYTTKIKCPRINWIDLFYWFYFCSFENIFSPSLYPSLSYVCLQHFFNIFPVPHFQINPLLDSHAQLMVHWLGEGTNVMICLAREPPLGPLEDPKSMPPPSPSSVYFSYDYGDTFQDKTLAFNISIDGKEFNSTLDQFMTHQKYNTVSWFVYLKKKKKNV